MDMAGYNDHGRNFVGVFGVSYMLKVALEKASMAKFILVVSQAKLMQEQVKDILKSF